MCRILSADLPVRLWLALSTLVVYAPTAKSAVISVPSESAAPGSSLFLSVTFDSQGSSVSGIQFDIHYDSSAMDLVAVVGDAVRNSGKTLYQANMGTGWRRFLIFGLNQNVMPDGALIGLFANLKQDVPTTAYPVTLSNIIATDMTGQITEATGLDGSVVVEGTVGEVVRLRAAGVLNGGSLLPGPVAPGEFVTLIGSGIGPESEQVSSLSPTTPNLGGTSIFFNGLSAPLRAAGPDLINAIVPYSVDGNATANVEVIRDGRMIAALSLPVSDVSPAIFTPDLSGVGPGAIVNEDSTVNSPGNPAAKGSVIVVFATGAGQTDPPGIDGQIIESVPPRQRLPVSVRIGDIDSEVLYAGPATGLLAGFLVVQCRVPEDTLPGFTIPIVLTAGMANSQAGVTLAVK